MPLHWMETAMHSDGSFSPDVRAGCSPRPSLVCATRLLAGCLAALIFLTGCRRSEPRSDKTQADRADSTAAIETPALDEPSDASSARALIREHHALLKAGTEPTAEQCKRFAEAYHLTGVELSRCGKHQEAEQYLRAALRLDPQHANATLAIGELLAARRQFKAAALAYKRAEELDSKLSSAVAARRRALLQVVLRIADQRAADCAIAGAKQVLDFVHHYLDDVGGDEARARLEQIKPLLRAEELLNSARQDIARFRKPDAYAKLREVAANWPRTFFAQEANRLLEANGQRIVLQATATGFKLPPHWRRTTTEHFEIYHEKPATPTGTMRYAEKAFDKIVADFGMDDADWKTRVTMYLFSDRESWREFLAMNSGLTHEWSGGFAVPSANEIYVYVNERKSNLYRRVLPHELTHVLHHRYVGGADQPLWLKEGLAQHQEKGCVKEARRRMADLVKAGQALPLRALFGLTAAPGDAVRLFYAQSATVVGFMIDEYGLEKLKQFMFAFKGGAEGEEAIASVYGIDLDTFEEKWRKYVR